MGLTDTLRAASDHLNTPRRMTNESGQAVWQWSYSAFGDEKPAVAKYRFANLDVNPNPGTTSIAEVTNNLRYPGQYADKESGLHYNYFRSYDGRTGRYSQSDPIGLRWWMEPVCLCEWQSSDSHRSARSIRNRRRHS